MNKQLVEGINIFTTFINEKLKREFINQYTIMNIVCDVTTPPKITTRIKENNINTKNKLLTTAFSYFMFNLINKIKTFKNYYKDNYILTWIPEEQYIEEFVNMFDKFSIKSIIINSQNNKELLINLLITHNYKQEFVDISTTNNLLNTTKQYVKMTKL